MLKQKTPLKRSSFANRGKPLQNRGKGLAQGKGLTSKTGLNRGSGLQTKTPLQARKPWDYERKPIAQKSATKREKRMVDEDHLAFVRTLPCLVCGIISGEAHHLLSAPERGMSRRSDDNHTLPLCHRHHMALHHTGNERKYLLEHAALPEPVQLSELIYGISGNELKALGLIARFTGPDAENLR